MRTNLFLSLFLLSSMLAARGQGTAFTYQGRLNNGSGPANGDYDFRFAIFDSSANGNQIGGELTNTATGVTNGLFMVTLDFGPIFTGTNYWLEIGVRTNGGGAFTTLEPRQLLSPTPYAIMANSASNLLGPLPSAGLSGTYNGPVTFNNGLDEFYGTFSGDFYGPSFIGGSFTGEHFGDGSGLYNLNPGAFSGPIPNTFLVNAWKTTGNAGTTPGANFLGTTDNQSLELHVNGQRGLQLLPDQTTNNAPDIVIGSPLNGLTGTLTGTTISGGGWNTIGPSSLFSTNNPYGDTSFYPIGASYSTIGGGFLNQIQSGATFSTIGGGALNTIANGNVESTIGGGFDNAISYPALWSTIAGGTHHTIFSENGFIGGGWTNTIYTNSSYSAIAGGLFNVISNGNSGSVIGGGDFNLMLGGSSYSFIGSGYHNILGPDGTNSNSGGYESAIASGYFNSIYEYCSFIGAGQQNSIGPLADHSVIGGGQNNIINGSTGPVYAVIGGGLNNLIQSNASYPFIGGGYGNLVLSNSTYAEIPGGYSNVVGGNGSFAAGSFAQATNDGTFVWSDDSSTNAFTSTASNQFLVRATGGVGIGTNDPAATLHVVAPGTGTNIALRVSNGGIAVSGFGLNTPTAAFVQVANSTNTGLGSYITTIFNPICDNDPNALLFVTHNWNPPGVIGNYESNTFSVFYEGPHWTIYNDNRAPILGMSFNVLIVKP